MFIGNLNIIGRSIYGGASGYLLDTYSAAAAYSLRQLKTGVTNVVRVRRSSDNAESDFTATEITDGTLASFCSATDGFVTTLYEQSGSGKANFTQTTTANQPKIVSSGTVLVNGSSQPYLDFDGSNDSMTVSGIFASSVSHLWSFSVKNSQDFDIVRSHGGATWSWEVLTANGFLNDTHRVAYSGYGYGATASTISTGQALLTSEYNRNLRVRIYVNGSMTSTAIVSPADLRGSDVLDIARTAGSGWRQMQFQEFIVFNTDESSNRTSIESDIDTHYWGADLLLDTYSGAAAAYSLRKLSKFTTNVVRVRRSSDNAESDFTADEITDGTLTTWTGANDGFVVTWYDQSGNANDVTQSTAANQPQLVASGVVNKMQTTASNGYGMQFDGTNDILNLGSNLSALNSESFSIFSFVRNEGGSSLGIFLEQRDSSSPNYGVSTQCDRSTAVKHTTIDGDAGAQNFTITSTTNNNQERLLSTIVDSSKNIDVFYNGSNTDSGTITSTTFNGSANMVIGSSAAFSIYYQVRIGELIIFNSDESANRTAIESDINTYYSIY